MRIIGIDPGVATIGIGCIEVQSRDVLHAVDWFTIQTAPHQPLEHRLCEIYTDLTSVLKEHSPELVVLEKIYFTSNEKTVIDVAHARGVIAMAVALHGIPIVHVTPLQLKNAITGDGKADKTQVMQMVMRILSLQEVPTPDDAADALALAMYGSIVAPTL